MGGTAYNSKDDLLNAILSLVYANTSNQVSCTDIQTAMNDIVESLWGQGVTVVEVSDYANDLVDAINNSTLQEGAIYQFTYQCVHLMPHTTELNTDSNTVDTETFYAKALSDSTLSPIVVSKENPEDLILMDFLDYTAEDGSTARTGKVLYRKDYDTGNETPYDFRGVYFRRYNIDYSSYPSVSTGDDLSFNTVYLYNNTLYKSFLGVSGWDGITSGVLYNVDAVQNTDSYTTYYWLPYDGMSFCGITLNADTSDYEDVTTFDSSCAEITVLPCDQNNGYNNIVFKNVNNYETEKGSYDSNIIESSRSHSSVQVVNSLLTYNNDIDAGIITGCYINDNDNANFVDISQSSITFSEDITIGSGATNINLVISKYSSIGPLCENFAGHYFWESTVGSGATNYNTIVNCKNISVGNDFGTNGFCTLAGMTNCSIGHGATSISMTVSGTGYDEINNMRIGNGVSFITIGSGASIEDMVLENGVSNISIDANSRILTTTFKQDSGDVNIEGGTFRGVEFGVGSRGFTFLNYCSIRGTKFNRAESSNNTDNLYTNGYFDATTMTGNTLSFSPQYNSPDFSLGSSSSVYAASSYLAWMTGMYYYYNIESSSVISIDGGQSISFSVGNGSNVSNSSLGNASVLSVGDGCFLATDKICDGSNVTIGAGDNVQGCRFGENSSVITDGVGGALASTISVQGCTFGPAWSGTLQSGVDYQVFTYSTTGATTPWDANAGGTQVPGGYGNIETDIDVSQTVTPVPSITDPKVQFLYTVDGDLTLTIDPSYMAPGRDYSFTFIVSASSSETFQLRSTINNTLLIDLAAGGPTGTAYITANLKRVVSSGGYDVLLVTNYNTLLE